MADGLGWEPTRVGEGARRRSRVGVGATEALGAGVGEGEGVGAGTTVNSPDNVAWMPIAGRPGAAAVALPERAGGSDDVPGSDGRAAERRVADDDPDGAAAVIDRDAEPVAQRRRRRGHRPADRQPQAFE